MSSTKIMNPHHAEGIAYTSPQPMKARREAYRLIMKALREGVQPACLGLSKMDIQLGQRDRSKLP